MEPIPGWPRELTPAGSIDRSTPTTAVAVAQHLIGMTLGALGLQISRVNAPPPLQQIEISRLRVNVRRPRSDLWFGARGRIRTDDLPITSRMPRRALGNASFP
jgi:hypothetical protein